MSRLKTSWERNGDARCQAESCRASRGAPRHECGILGKKFRTCKAIGCRRMTIRYRSIRPDDTVLRERMRAIARERRRFGCRRLHVMLKREGLAVNHKKLFRLHREEKLCVRRRGGRKRACRPIGRR